MLEVKGEFASVEKETLSVVVDAKVGRCLLANVERGFAVVDQPGGIEVEFRNGFAEVEGLFVWVLGFFVLIVGLFVLVLTAGFLVVAIGFLVVA